MDIENMKSVIEEFSIIMKILIQILLVKSETLLKLL